MTASPILPSPVGLPAAAPATPASPSPAWRVAGLLSMGMATAAFVVLCLDDPYLLTLPCTLLAVLLGGPVVRRNPMSIPGQVGLNLGLLGLVLWTAVILIVKWMLHVDLFSF